SRPPRPRPRLGSRRRTCGGGSSRAQYTQELRRQRRAELLLIVLRELVARDLVLLARVRLAERVPRLRELRIDGDRLLQALDPGLRRRGIAQREHARQVERPRLLRIGGQRTRACGARRVDLAQPEREVAARGRDAGGARPLAVGRGERALRLTVLLG